MYAYDYYEHITDDIVDHIQDNFTAEEVSRKLRYERDEWEEELNDDLWVCDGVTGNASGSHTFNTYKAEECLCHNLDLLCAACDEFECDVGEAIKKGAEHCDVTIRCYLLSVCIAEALDRLNEGVSDIKED